MKELIDKLRKQSIEVPYDEFNLMHKAADALERLELEVNALKLDAEQWRAYKARKDAAIKAGFGKSPLRSDAPNTYAVINKEGEVEYSAAWPEACHDHIKEMQEAIGLGHVVGWKVRGIKILPTYKDAAMGDAT